MDIKIYFGLPNGNFGPHCSVQLKPNPKAKNLTILRGKKGRKIGQTQVFDLGGSDIGFISHWILEFLMCSAKSLVDQRSTRF